MNKQELNDWIKSATFDCFAEDINDDGNLRQTLIYKKDGKLYSIDYCNHEPNEVWGERGYIRGVYQPKEVTRHTRMIKETYYEPVEPCRHTFIGKDLLCSKCGQYFPETNL